MSLSPVISCYVSSPPLSAAMGVEISFFASGDDGDDNDDNDNDDGSTLSPFSAEEEHGRAEEGVEMRSSLCP